MIRELPSKLKNILYFFASGICFLLMTVWCISGYIKLSESKDIKTPEEASEFRADCILILGAGITADGVPMSILEDRLNVGIDLFERGISDRLLMSGDHRDENYNEVYAMKQYAIDADVPSTDIFMDHAGFSTYESLYRAKYVYAVQKVVIVTQSYHLPRALFIADALGLEAIGIPADLREYTRMRFYAAREKLARVKDFLYAWLLPPVDVSDGIIPVSGNGDITNDKDFRLPGKSDFKASDESMKQDISTVIPTAKPPEPIGGNRDWRVKRADIVIM